MDQMVYNGLSCRHNLFPKDEPTVNTHYPKLLNSKVQQLYNMLYARKRSLWHGCEISQLAVVTNLLSIKSKLDFTKQGYNMFSDYARHINHAKTTLLESFYGMKKVVEGFSLPYKAIDYCINGCMMYYGVDSKYVSCKVCDHLRYNQGKTKLVLFSCTFYLPIK